MAVRAFRRESEKQRFEKDGEGLPRVALLRNTASARLACCFKSKAVRPPVMTGRLTEYLIQSRNDGTLGRRLARGLPITKPGARRREEITPKSYRLQTGANTVLRRESRFRPPKALRRNRALKAYNRLSVYQGWQTSSLHAPAARADAVDGATRARSEFKWLALNRHRYAGHWVALDGSTLLAAGQSAREVYAAIASHEGTPLVTRVEPEDEAYFAGW